jgi:hypothetical protein
MARRKTLIKLTQAWADDSWVLSKTAAEVIPVRVYKYLLACKQAFQRHLEKTDGGGSPLYLQREDLCAITGNKSPWISKVEQDLAKHNLLINDPSPGMSLTNASVKLLKSIPNIIEVYEAIDGPVRAKPGPASRSDNSRALQIIQSQENMELLSLTEGEVAWHDGIGISILDACVRSSVKDPAKVIETKYYFGKPRYNDYLFITTTTETGGGEIMILPDLRLVRTLMDMYQHWLWSSQDSEINKSVRDNLTENFGTTEGFFCFDIRDICSAMELQNTRSNRDAVRAMLNRVTETTFNIDASNSKYYQAKWPGMKQKYRFITEFYSVSDMIPDIDGQPVGEVYYVVRFHSSLTRSLSERRYSSHRAMLSEWRAIPQRLYTFCKTNVGASLVSSKPLEIALDNLAKALLPGSRPDSVIEQLKTFLSKEAALSHREGWGAGAVHSTTYNGFHISWRHDPKRYRQVWSIHAEKDDRMARKNKFVVQIERDRNDPLIGDHAKHNVQSRTKLRKLTDIEADVPQMMDLFDTSTDRGGMPPHLTASLRKQGISTSQLIEASKAFKHFIGSEEEFSTWAVSRFVSQETAASLLLPEHWVPNQNTIDELKQHYSPDLLKDAASRFRQSVVDNQDTSLTYPDKAFKSYIDKVYPLTPEKTANGWLPSKAARKEAALLQQDSAISSEIVDLAIREIRDMVSSGAMSPDEGEKAFREMVVNKAQQDLIA